MQEDNGGGGGGGGGGFMLISSFLVGTCEKIIHKSFNFHRIANQLASMNMCMKLASVVNDDANPKKICFIM